MTPSCFDLYFLQTMCPSLNCFVLSLALNLIWLSEATFIFFPQKSELTEFIIPVIQIVWMHVHIVRVKSQFVSFEFHYQMYRNNIPKCNFFFSNTSIQTDLWGCSFASIYYFVSCQLFLIKERKFLNFKTLPVSKHMVLIHPKNVIFHYSSITTINYHEMPYVYQRRYYKFVR